MKFSVCHGLTNPIGVIDVEEDVYADDDALLNVLAEAGYVDSSELLEVREDEEGRVDIFEYETNYHRLALYLIH